MSENSAASFARIGSVAFGIGVLAIASYFDLFGRFSEPRILANSLVELGTVGYVAFALAYTIFQPFGVPGSLFIVAAPILWPWPVAFALSMAGTMGASVVGFAFARFVARDWVNSRIPDRFSKYGGALERRGFSTVAMLRLVLWMPQPLHWFFGVSKVPFWTHFWGSFFGYVPPLFVVSYFGGRMFDSSGTMRPEAWPVLGGLLAISLAIAAFTWARARRGSGLRTISSSLSPGTRKVD